MNSKLPRMPRFGICFTINNYSDLDVTMCREAVGQCGIKYIIFGKEVGEQGTPHLQGYMQTNHDKFDRFKHRFGRGIHLEKQKGSSDEARDYCKKEGDWVEFGQYEHIAGRKERQGKRKDLEEVHELVKSGKTYDEICETHFDTCAKYSRFIKEQVKKQEQGGFLQEQREKYSGCVLRPWQALLKDVLDEEPHPRRITWIWEPTGNTGKSWMTGYLRIMHGALVLQVGKGADLAYILANTEPFPKVVIFDLPRTTDKSDKSYDPLTTIYSIAESLKNGYLQSTKYESTAFGFKPPHVVFFANFEPDYTKWSEDRYFVTRL